MLVRLFASVLGAPFSETASSVAPPAKGRALVPQAQQEALPPIIDAHNPRYKQTWGDTPIMNLVGLEHPVLDHFASLHTELNIFMWGDSTMKRQFYLLRGLTGGLSTETAPSFQIAVSMPDEKLGANAAVCPDVSVSIHKATFGNATISLTLAVCETGATSIAEVPALLEVLQQKPYELTLPAGSLLYIGGAGLHHLHDDDRTDAELRGPALPRGWLTMKPLLEAFEDNTKFGLAKLQEQYPKAKLGYFNTHTIAEEKFFMPSTGARARAVACASRDSEVCFSGVNVSPEERDSFRDTLLSRHGTDVMAKRERAVLKDPSLKWTVVDGHKISRDAGSTQTPDGVHYFEPTMMQEIEAALTVLRRDRRP